MEMVSALRVVPICRVGLLVWEGRWDRGFDEVGGSMR